MFQFYQFLEDGVVENIVRVLRFIIWEWGFGFVEVYVEQGSFVGVVGVGGYSYAVGVFEVVCYYVVFVVGYFLFGV